MTEPAAPSDDTQRFGELRSALEEPPDALTWALVCALMEGWPPDRLAEMVVPYVRARTRGWPATTLEAPRVWLGAAMAGRDEPRLKAARAIICASLRYLPRALDQLADEGVVALTLQRGAIEPSGTLSADGEPLTEALAEAIFSHRAMQPLQRLTLEDITLTDDPSRAAAALARLPRLERLRLTTRMAYDELTEQVALTLADAEGFASLRALTLDGLGVQADALRALLHADVGRHLDTLHLTRARLGEELVDLLHEAPALPRLRELRLSQWDPLFLEGYRPFTEDALARLLDHPSLRLRSLSLRWHTSRDSGWAACADPNARALDALDALEIATSDWDPDGLRTLAASARLGQLRRLSVRLQFRPLHDTDDGLVTLAASPHLAQLEALTIERATSDAILALAKNPHLSRLRALEITHQGMTVEGLRALASAPHLASLRALTIHTRGPHSDGVLALLRSPHLRQLDALTVTGSQLGDDLYKSIAAGEGPPRLRALSLIGQPLTTEAARHLAGSPHLSRLRALHLNASTARTPAEARALLTDARGLAPSVRAGFAVDLAAPAEPPGRT